MSTRRNAGRKPHPRRAEGIARHAQGEKLDAIAADLGVSKTTVSAWGIAAGNRRQVHRARRPS